MHYGICLLSVVPCRREAASTSEMVTQLLFGETYSVTENGEDWLKITTTYDHYECWISARQHHRISESTFKQIQKEKPIYCAEIFANVTDKNKNRTFPLSLGARLPLLNGSRIIFESENFEFSGKSRCCHDKGSRESIIRDASNLINAPYMWGGKSPLGIDCSGFTQIVYKLNGYSLPRDASQQVELGQPLNFVEEAEPGDLAFFDNEEGRIVHVGIIIDKEKIIHASGCVRIDRYDHYGIHNADIRKYSHSLRVIKRVV